MSPADLSDAALVGLLLDGPADHASQRELARRAAADPALARLLRLHLRISEMAEHAALPERGAAAFAAGWVERLAAEDDAAVFTARTMLRIAADRSERRSGWMMAGLRAGGLAAAALLFICIGWVGSAIHDAGRAWLASSGTRAENPAIVQRETVLRALREEMR